MLVTQVCETVIGAARPVFTLISESVLLLKVALYQFSHMSNSNINQHMELV